MRCGGWRNGTSDGKTIIRGYHQDVTDVHQKHERIETAIKMVNDAYFKICYIDLNTNELFTLKAPQKVIIPGRSAIMSAAT